MINKVISTIKKYSMISEGKTVVAAVSGGSDSMAMLHALCAVKDELGFQLKAVHVNHGIRGADADADERFVARYCRQIGIPLDIFRADVIGEAKRLGLGLEETGRKIRYDYFSSFGSDVLVATAHNSTDRAETFLFNFSRGSALRGLGSIPPVRDNYIRPLIECSKAEIEAYCAENGIEFVTDKTNDDVTYSRNRIRHNVLPQLRQINPSFEAVASRCIDSLRDDEKFLSDCADELVSKATTSKGFDANILSATHGVIRKRALIKIIESVCGITPEFRFIDELSFILSNGGSRQINGGVTVRVRGGLLEFPSDSDAGFEPVELTEGSLKVGSADVTVSLCNVIETDCSQKVLNDVLIYYIDYDKILGKAFFRGRQAGDKICLKRRGCTKTLKKLFNELSIPPEKRDSVTVLSDDNGVLLVEGIGVDSRAEVSAETKKIVVISFKRSV